MKKIFSLSLILFFFQHWSSAQDQHIIDSLEDKLKNLQASQQEALLESQQQIEKSNKSLTLGIAFGMGGALLGMISVASIFYMQRNKITREKEISEEERLKTEAAKKQSEELLLNILPSEIADEIKRTGTATAKSFTMVTVMFTDFKDFTSVSEKVSAELLVDEIHTCFSAFDHIMQKHKIEKIKTIGDSYLCASGLPVSNYTHATDMLNAAFEIRNYMLQRKKEKERRGEVPFELRIGIHTGPVVAGIVGVRKYAYDIWGDTVNLAARMEQNSEAGKVNISGSTYELVKDKFNCVHRGKIQAKNKGEIDMYFVES
ncbi:MAG: adenylate/guanylate cyclase domain-containing protein [Bacteroidia bacterium]